METNRLLKLDDLVYICRRETQKFRQGSPHEADYCLELFRRALGEDDQAAWRAVYELYYPLVRNWVWRYPGFRHSEEEASFFVNVAFARFWHGLSRPGLIPRLDSLNRLLNYLKGCVHSAITDHARRQLCRPAAGIPWHDLAETIGAEPCGGGGDTAEALERAVMNRINTGEEKLVARLSWFLGLRPRQIQARHPDLFPEVSRVYQIKRNILERLLRDPEIQNLRKQIP